MTIFGLASISQLMLLITSKQGSLWMDNVFGSKNLYSNQEPQEQNAIPRSSSLMLLSAILILLILLKKAFLSAPLKTSRIKFNILSNGLETILKVLSQSLLLSCQASLKIESPFWQNLKSNIDRILQHSELNLSQFKDFTMPIKRKTMLPASNWPSLSSKMYLTIK